MKYFNLNIKLNINIYYITTHKCQTYFGELTLENMEKIAENADNVHVKWVLLENMILCSVENVLEKVLISLDLQKQDDLYA